MGPVRSSVCGGVRSGAADWASPFPHLPDGLCTLGPHGAKPWQDGNGGWGDRDRTATGLWEGLVEDKLLDTVQFYPFLFGEL